MAMMEMEQVKEAALKYDKPTLARLAQSGQLSPTLAVMAGMMRDRIVQSEMKPPQQTVAQEVMQPMGQRMGLAAAAQPQQPRPQGQGLNQVPVPPQMFDRQGMAGGGIVAFQAGGDPRARVRASTPSRATIDPRAKPGSVSPSAVRQARILMQSRPGLSLTGALKVLGFPVAAATTGYELTQGLMATDKGGITDIAPTPGYDYGAETMAGGRPEIPVESVGTREQSPGFTDYLRAVGLAPREQAMDPATGKFVDVPAKPIFESATPGLAGVKDQTDVEKRIAAAEAGVGPDVERNSERAAVAEARRQDLLKQAAEAETKKAEAPKVQAGPTKEAAAKEEGKKTFNDYLTEVQRGMGTSKVGDDTREEIRKDRAARKKEEQNAMWMGLVEAGLGIMGGESPYAAVNIGKGATNALKSYADRLREQKKLDREDRRILLDLEKAERAELRDNYRLASESYNKALDRISAEERTRIAADATRFAAQSSADVARQAYSMMKPASALGEERQRIALAQEQIRNLPITNPDYRKSTEAQKKQMQDNIYLQLGIDPVTKKFMYGQAGQMPGLNLGAWGQLTTVPGAR